MPTSDREISSRILRPYSLRRMMIWVAVAAFGVSLLRSRSEAAAGFAISFLLAGAVRGWFAEGPRRAFWWGFAGVGGAYLTLVYIYSAAEYSIGVGFPTTWPLIHLGESWHLFASAPQSKDMVAFLTGIENYLKVAHSLVGLGCGAVTGAAAFLLVGVGRGVTHRARRLDRGQV